MCRGLRIAEKDKTQGKLMKSSIACLCQDFRTMDLLHKRTFFVRRQRHDDVGQRIVDKFHRRNHRSSVEIRKIFRSLVVGQDDRFGSEGKIRAR